MTTDVGFHIDYRGKDADELPVNPRINFRIDAGDTSIPGEDSTYSVFELPFWLTLLRVIDDARTSDGDARTFFEVDGGAILLFDQVGRDRIEIANRYSEEAIDDESERLGIENSATVSVEDFTDAVLKRARSTLQRIRKDHPDADDNRIKLIEEEIEKITGDS